ncbi:flagellar motor protein MotB [Bradyrhizobium sp. LM2.3]
MNEVKSELVIIRRRSAFDDEKPHGGVWKIAYADFMTAMMAFFLVMWLINALNQDQKQVVASYFNPIMLAENAPAPKGLKDLSKKEPSSLEGQDGRRQPAGPSEERRGDSPTAEKPPFYEEKVLFRDPYTTLAEIASSANQASGQRRAGALTSAEEDGLKGGDAYRDPFDPGYWKLAPQASKDADRIMESESKPNASARDTASGTGPGEPQARRAKQDDAGGSVAPIRRCIVRKPVAPAAAGAGALAVFTRRERPAGRPGRHSSQRRCAVASQRYDEGIRAARRGSDAATDGQAASVGDRGGAVGCQGRRGTGG